MGSKRTLDYSGLVVDGDMSTNITSPSTNILHMDRVGYEISYTGTPTGTFSVQVSNSGDVWQDLTLSEAIEASGSADNHYIDVESACKFVRLKYTAGSGSGTMQVYISGKSISG